MLYNFHNGKSFYYQEYCINTDIIQAYLVYFLKLKPIQVFNWSIETFPQSQFTMSI